MATDQNSRKTIAQRIIDNASARSMPVDTSPEIIALLDEWVRGDIQFEEMRIRHAALLKEQAAERRKRVRGTVVDDTAPVIPIDDLHEKKGHENRGP